MSPHAEVAMPFCQSCGHPAREGHKFCSRCGATVDLEPARPPSPGTPVARRPPVTSALAVIALLCSLVPVCLNFIGVILGVIALFEVGRRPDKVKGRGLAIAAITIGLLWVALAVGGVLGGPSLVNYWGRSRQSEARANLEAIAAACRTASEREGSPPSTFAEVGFNPGPGRRYTYFIGDDVLEPTEGLVRSLPPDLPADDTIAVAVGELPLRSSPDVWTVNSKGEVKSFADATAGDWP